MFCSRGIAFFVFALAFLGCGDGKVCPTCPDDTNPPPPPPPPESQLWKLPAKYLMTYVAANSSGVYVTGKTIDSVSGAATFNMFTAKFNLDGTMAWLVEQGEGGGVLSCGVAVNEGRNLVHVGRIQGANYVDTRDAETGRIIWSTAVDGGGTWCHDIAADETTVYLVFGLIIFELDASNGSVTGSLSVSDIGGVPAATSFNSVSVYAGMLYAGGETIVNLITHADVLEDFFVVAVEKGRHSRKWVGEWGDDSLPKYYTAVAVAPQAGLVYLTGLSADLTGPTENRATIVQGYDILDGGLRFTTRLGPTSPGLASDGKDAYLALPVYGGASPQSPIRLRPDGSVAWIASPPRDVESIAVSGGVVYATRYQPPVGFGVGEIVGNRLLRYDAATGVMKQ
jgi:hypothetical protein